MPHPGPSQSQVRTAIGNCDHVETMAKRVQIGEDLLTSCFEQEDRGETPDWELVRGLPGIRLEPMCWDEASALIADGTLTSLAKLGRLPSDTRKYRKFRSEHILATYASVTDYLYASVFNLECKTKDEKLIAVVPDDFRTKERIDFPYAFKHGIEHHVLWSSLPLDHDKIIIEATARRDSQQGWELIYFINPPVLKSVPAVS
ncbi:hypothetical protein Ndes2526A_g04968 [Nannochloris sp. 'desiccata']